MVAAKFMTKYGMGIVGDVIVGVIGANIGNWLAPRLGVHFGTGLARARRSERHAGRYRLDLAGSLDPACLKGLSASDGSPARAAAANFRFLFT